MNSRILPSRTPLLRIPVFSTTLKDREDITGGVKKYFEADKQLRRYLGEIEFKGYSSLSQPERGEQLGHRREVLVVFDEELSPKEDYTKPLLDRKRQQIRLLTRPFRLSQKLCDEEGIPYIIYRERSKTDREESSRVALMFLQGDLVKIWDKIISRLEESLTAH